MNVLLDLDGTLTDPRDGIIRCIQHALHCLGDRCPPDAELEDYIGPPLQTSFNTLFANDPIKTAQAIHLYRQRFSSIGIFENRVYPDVSAALAILRDLGAVLIVATSKPTVFAERIIAHFDLGEYIGSVYGSELDGTRSEKA